MELCYWCDIIFFCYFYVIVMLFKKKDRGKHPENVVMYFISIYYHIKGLHISVLFVMSEGVYSPYITGIRPHITCYANLLN